MAQVVITRCARRRQQSEMEQRRALQHISQNKTKVGWAWGKVCAIWRDPECCFFSSTTWLGQRREESFWGLVARKRNTRVGGGVQESPARCARHKHTRMAGVEDTMRAAVPSWYGGLEREIIYRRTNYIHEMSCGEVGSHLYSRMCCAGRSERSAPVTGGGSGWEGLMGMLLTFSMPPPTIQQAPRVKRVGVREVSHFIII